VRINSEDGRENAPVIANYGVQAVHGPSPYQTEVPIVLIIVGGAMLIALFRRRS